MIPDCKRLTHPFLNDPGTSQGQRILDDLLSGNAKVDNRSMADLLDFFMQLSRHINYYDEKLEVSDWQPFFQKSLPFVLTSIIKFDRDAVKRKLDKYQARFVKKPSARGLYLLLRYMYSQLNRRIDNWDRQIKNSGLPLETAMDKLIKDKLSGPLKSFIQYCNAASHYFGTPQIRFNKFLENEGWNLIQTDLYKEDTAFMQAGNTRRKRLIALYNQAFQLNQTFRDVIRLFSISAVQSLDQSLLPLKEELQEKHPPHLALIFAFIRLFQHLQDDLNSYTKKHLDYFYKEVLQLKPKEAVPDKLHLILEIQTLLDSYLFRQGLLFKDGKDNNKAEILFSNNEEIVVNKTQVADQRTLFINNQAVRWQLPGNNECNFDNAPEGVYIASNATMADGVDKPFKDGLPSRAALGAKWSKYTDPENKFIYPYPNARLGFIMASPVLLLQEGTRTIRIKIPCKLSQDYCKNLNIPPTTTNPCCDETRESDNGRSAKAVNDCQGDMATSNLLAALQNALGKRYYYVSRPLIASLVKKGISKELKEKLEGLLLVRHQKNPPAAADKNAIEDPLICYCSRDEKFFDNIIEETDFTPWFTSDELDIIRDIIYPRNAWNVFFSGEKEWITPKNDNPANLKLKIDAPGGALAPFTISIEAIIEPEQKAITFYNADALKEDFNTELPLVKVEMDDKIKIKWDLSDCGGNQRNCCDRPLVGTTRNISLYHFFREVKVLPGTTIDVQVCGLKNFVVQNDESLQDVNAPIYPFGTRPAVIGFDLVNPVPSTVEKNLVGPNFYIGSSEVFGKKWNDVYINLQWKNKPKDFNEYYKAYWVDPADNTKFGLNKDDFQLHLSVLQDGAWKDEINYTGVIPPPHNNTILNTITGTENRKLFDSNTASTFCDLQPKETQTIHVASDYFNNIDQEFRLENEKLVKLEASTRNWFLKLNLQNQDFLHKDYAYVLARQMMALGKFPDSFLEDATYLANGSSVIVFNGVPEKIGILDAKVNESVNLTGNAKQNVLQIESRANQARQGGSPGGVNITNNEFLVNPDINTPIQNAKSNTGDAKTKSDEIRTTLTAIEQTLKFWDFSGNKLVDKLAVLIPNEPWTPIISQISIDYTATAKDTDIDLIHLYPYPGTYKAEEIKEQPMLFPTFCDEGTFYIGLKDLVPGSNLNILFQLSEATADSETERESLSWYYLENNIWKLLRPGFELLRDDTDDLTTSGIIKFQMPANMTKENSILPTDLHWIKATIPCKSRAVAELTGIHTQAILATFTNDDANDKLRLSEPLPAASVSKLKTADANAKKITQPYDSFGGRVPEEEGHFYVRVSELLRHKNRAIQKFDYERLVLEAFPKVFKAKCINHTYALDAEAYVNDFTLAPGYVLIAVIPDLNQLKAAESFEPRVPVSMLEQIETCLKKITSPFVRLRIMNPRYEKVNFCIRVKLQEGKDEVYYKQKLADDIRTFLAPWAIGEYEKLSFGQPVYRSDIIRFLEAQDYIDYIIELGMARDDNPEHRPFGIEEIRPITARSILVAGNIDVCIDHPGCETWCYCGDRKGNENQRPCCDHPAIPIHEEPEIVIT